MTREEYDKFAIERQDEIMKTKERLYELRVGSKAVKEKFVRENCKFKIGDYVAVTDITGRHPYGGRIYNRKCKVVGVDYFNYAFVYNLSINGWLIDKFPCISERNLYPYSEHLPTFEEYREVEKNIGDVVVVGRGDSKYSKESFIMTLNDVGNLVHSKLIYNEETTLLEDICLELFGSDAARIGKDGKIDKNNVSSETEFHYNGDNCFVRKPTKEEMDEYRKLMKC